LKNAYSQKIRDMPKVGLGGALPALNEWDWL